MGSRRTDHVTITLTGAIQSLPTLNAGRGVRALSFQPGAANAAPVYLGGPEVSATDYGVRLPAAAAGEPPGPYIPGEFTDGTIGPEDWYFIGANGEKLHVHYVLNM